MKCPHCTTSFHESWSSNNILQERPGGPVWRVHALFCPECSRFVAELRTVSADGSEELSRHLVWPQHAVRPVPAEVEPRFADNYKEAAATLGISPKASAALSRRCLQDALREKTKVKHANLDREIQEVIDSGSAPSWLAQNLDAVRVVGNFAAHPIKSENTGEVVDVEPGEAEFLLDVLDGLFDFYFVSPERAKKQRDALDAKLQDAGKPPLKS